MGTQGYFSVPGELQQDGSCAARWAGGFTADRPEQCLSATAGESPAGSSAAPLSRPCSGAARAAALLLSPLLALATVGGLAGFGSRGLPPASRPGAELSLLGASEAAHCEPDVEEVDLWTGVPLYEVQGVGSAADCRSKCTDDNRCGAWTWGKKRNVKYLTDVCFLKEVRPGHPIERHDKKGVVSGLPCRPGEAPLRLPPKVDGPSFNCDTAFNNWKAAWSRAKKKFCCDNKERGCDSNSRPPTRSHGSAEAPAVVDCHGVAHDTDYWTGTPLYEVDNIGQAADCRAKCEADPNCGAWTWGEKPGIAGLEGVCFLKRLPEGQKPRQDPKKGVQSGVPCRGDSASAASGAEKESRSVAVVPHRAGHGNCGEIEDDTDYSTSTSLSEIDNVATAEICLLKCEGDVKCSAWSWGKERNSPGLTDMCFLKGLRHGETPQRSSKEGVQSGLPCHTSSWLQQEGRSGLQHYQSVTLFCFALMLPHSYEENLLRMQFYERASLFACDQFAVYSNMTIELDPRLITHVVNSDLHCEFGGEFGTALNTDIFLAVWRKVVSDGIYLLTQWTCKVDPDAVFFAARLRGALEAHSECPEGVYINNCWRGMHGPVEVFSRNAVTAWSRGVDRCQAHFNKLCNGPCLWGEDMFIDQCLWKVLHVRRDNEYALLTEDHCDPPKGWKSCKMPGSIAFHPFKKPKDYQECLFSADPLMRLAATPTTTPPAPVVYPDETVAEGRYADAAGSDGSLPVGGEVSGAAGSWSGGDAAATGYSAAAQQDTVASGTSAGGYGADAAAGQAGSEPMVSGEWATISWPSPVPVPAPMQAGQYQAGIPVPAPVPAPIR